jgi:hypothetical protein
MVLLVHTVELPVGRGRVVRKSDLDRVLKALQDAGQAVGQIEVRPDGIVLITPAAESFGVSVPANELDAWRARRATRSADRP